MSTPTPTPDPQFSSGSYPNPASPGQGFSQTTDVAVKPEVATHEVVSGVSGDQAEVESATEVKTCPECAEHVKAEALVCRFCGYRFDGVTAHASSSTMTAESASPVARAQQLAQVGMVLAILGAVLGVVAAFLAAVQTPNLGGIPIPVPNNSLLAAKDGWIDIALSVIALAFLSRAYVRRSNRALIGTALAGVAMVGVAIVDASNLDVGYIVYATGQTGTVSASAGAGVILAGISGAIIVTGATVARRRQAAGQPTGR